MYIHRAGVCVCVQFVCALDCRTTQVGDISCVHVYIMCIVNCTLTQSPPLQLQSKVCMCVCCVTESDILGRVQVNVSV